MSSMRFQLSQVPVFKEQNPKKEHLGFKDSGKLHWHIVIVEISRNLHNNNKQQQ